LNKLTLFTLSLALSGCAQLPAIDAEMRDSATASRESVSAWVPPLLREPESTRLRICDVDAPRELCSETDRGLAAVGLGGLFLPLKVSLPQMTVTAEQVALQVDINGIDAKCTTGALALNANLGLLEVGRVYCNWFVIGNVVSGLKLTLDWDDPASGSFGGRYRMRFIGTGNGSGSGIYTAQVQP